MSKTRKVYAILTAKKNLKGIIYMPKRHILGWHIWLPFREKGNRMLVFSILNRIVRAFLRRWHLPNNMDEVRK